MNQDRLEILSNQHTVKEISQIENITLSAVYYKLNKLGLRALKPKKDDIQLFDTYTLESCYWAGFIAADGNVLIKSDKGTYRISIHLAAKDYFHLEKFKSVISANNKISMCRHDGSRYIQIFSKHAVESIINNFNIIPNKSLILKPPKNMPDDQIKHYIRGYFDGDGHIGYKGGTHCNFNIVGASKEMIDWLSDQLKYFSLTTKSHTYKKKSCFCIDMNNQSSLKILDWFYSDSNRNTRLDRKYHQYCEYKESIQGLLTSYKDRGIRPPPGCKGFNLDYIAISQEYLSGSKLKTLASKYNISQWTLLARFKKLGVRKNSRDINSI